jgi:TPR repeat protein
MKLTEYFSGDREKFLKPTSLTGERSGWLDFCDLVLKGGSILVVDTQFVPSEKDGLLVKLTPGTYSVQAKAVNYGGDVRIARLRVVKNGISPALAEKLGETWTDTANTGICDFETFSQAWGKDDDASYQIIEPFFDTGEEFGIAVLDEARNALMPFVHSGFGDGSFPVFELQADGVRSGFEIEFIADGEEYSFDQTPYQRQNRVLEIESRAAQGDVQAQLQLGKMYQAGKEVEKNFEKAAQWFEKALQNRNAEAALALGVLYKNGHGVPKDYVRARELYESAAAGGSIFALNELGVLYRHGQGVPVDYEKAAAYFRQAAEKGFGNAQYNLGVHCGKGWGVQQSYGEAAKWYRLAADQGVLGAIFNLGCIYKRGEPGVQKDEKEAVKLFSLGAMNGHAGCANNLGDSYETGCGVEKDLKKAFTWYLLAAGNNIAIAQKSLGVLNKNGEGGVKKNLVLALKWLGKAAENGNAEACYELGLLYETGEGVAADKVRACKLCQKAVDGGFAKASEKLRELSATLSESERAAISENTNEQKDSSH